MKKVIIIGGGISGLTSAIYLSRSGFECKVFNGYSYGSLASSPVVENFPGFPEGIEGVNLLLKMNEQAQKFGAVISDSLITKIDSKKNIVIDDSNQKFEYDYLVVATGNKSVEFKAVNSDKFKDFIHYCAVCDGNLYRNQSVMIIGGGNTALTEALYLSNIAKKVIVVIRRNVFRAEKHLVDMIEKKENIFILRNTVITEFNGNDFLESVTVKTIYGEKEDIYKKKIDGVFIAIGNKKNDDLLVNEFGKDYINKLPKNIKLCGDIIENNYNQAIIASGDGAKTALEIINSF